MTLKLNYEEDIRMLRESAGGFFADAEPVKALRRNRDARDFDAQARGLWDGMAELGLTGTLIPEVLGGAGLGFRESVQIAALDMEIAAYEALVERYRDEAEAGMPIGAGGSMLKYFVTDLYMRRQDLMMSILGMAGLDRDAATADVSTEWLGWIANKIGGGSSEVQLNVVAKRVLGLPGA
jgi:alkylation response protein AidB-like acyl-CoA dehydrogenase